MGLQKWKDMSWFCNLHIKDFDSAYVKIYQIVIPKYIER